MGHHLRGRLPLATRLRLTEVQRDVEGDTFFPAWDTNNWREVSPTTGVADDVVFRDLERTS